jgi:hypothetical protein
LNSIKPVDYLSELNSTKIKEFEGNQNQRRVSLAMLTKLHKDAPLDDNLSKLKLEHLLAIKLYKTKEVEGSDR